MCYTGRCNALQDTQSKEGQMSASITFRISQDLYEKAKVKAKREDITLSQVLRRYLRQWIKDSPDQGQQKGQT